MPRIVVIGAGVMGASVAYRAALAGASVTVLEAGRIGGGTSGCSFAWTNSNEKTPRAYHDLNVAGMRAHAALAEELGATPWWHGGGSVEWEAPADHPAQQARVERLRAWGYAAEWITPRQLLELEPDIDPALIGDAPIAYFPEEGWLDPVVYIGAMLGAARSHGAVVIRGARVSETLLRGARITGVKTADGRLFEADVVVNCAGRWANDPVSEAGLHLPLAPTVGLLAFTPPVAARVGRVVRAPDIHTRPDGAGRLVCIAPTEALPAFDPRPSVALPEVRELGRRVCRLLPVIGDVEPEAARMAIRPIPGDSYSAVGPMPRVEGYYLAITHSGVTMSPFLGAAVADEIVHGRRRPELADFRPARFFN
jgi:glycine/D-amino acid oxidase-like deaminating enzyme